MTTVRSPNTLSRSSIATLIGATRSTEPRRGSRLTHATSSSRCSRSRSAFSKISSMAARATCRAPSLSSGLAGLSSVCTARQVSRTRASAIERVSGMPSSRPSGTSSRMPWNRMEASVTGSVSASRPARLAAAAIIEALSSSVIVEVTRSTSSCASSITSRSCSGSIWRPSKESIAMKLWLVTTMSTSLAASRARSTKHSLTIGHLEPRHSCAETETWRQARSLTPGTSSSRSPDWVSSAHSRSRTTSAPRRRAAGVAGDLADGEQRPPRRRGSRRRACAGTGSCAGP